MEREETTPPRLPRRTWEDDDDDSDGVWERPRPARRRRKSRPANNSNQKLLLLIGGIGAVLIFLGLGAAAVYYFGFSGRSGSTAEEQLIGNWETDPEPWNEAAAKTGFGVMFRPDIKLTFNKDYTYKLDFIMDWEGRWQIVSRDGNRLRVKLIAKVFGTEQSDPPTVSITMIDKDHIYFDANEPSLQMQSQFRRVGMGPPANPRPRSPDNRR